MRWDPAAYAKAKVASSRLGRGYASTKDSLGKARDTGAKVFDVIMVDILGNGKARGGRAGLVPLDKAGSTKTVKKQEARIIIEVQRYYDLVISQQGGQAIRVKIQGRLLEYRKGEDVMCFTAASVDEAEKVVKAFDNRELDAYNDSQAVRIHIKLS